MVKIDNKVDIDIKTKKRGNPKWHKGMASPNPKGNTHAKDIAGLVEALDNRSKRAGYKDFNALVADRALQYETVLIAVMKKVYPEQPLIDQSHHHTFQVINYGEPIDNKNTSRILQTS